MVIFPFYKISKKLFGRTIIRSYGIFIIIRGKIRSNRKARIYSILTHNYTVHATIIIITLGIFISNVTLAGKITLAADNVNSQPPLFYLINSEFAEDEELVIETFSGSEFISPAEEDYLKNLSSVRVQPQLEIKSTEEADLTETDSTVQGGSAVISPNIAKTKKVQRERKTIVYHTVQPNDTISTISQQYDVSVATILWENDLNSYSIIRPGQRLAILPISGISYLVAKGDTMTAIAGKYDVEQEEILEFNNIIDSAYLKIGQKIIIPGGQKKYIAQTSTQYSGLDALKSLVTPKSAQPAPGNKMNWPTEGHRITQYYNWQHYAVDIANKIGTPIYAADAGTVESAGWGTGYGNQIVIDHGGGKKTRYAHASKLFVAVGDEITKGQTIAAMGSTGNSTGSHVHFEVIINGRKYNPLDYIR
ncbi:MAG: peptidoglycan DD-metalloendopeptidase family protein [bacterium]|nr:peptidoglycan DD-metalloendopeptidase family protein [bacterium]